MMGGETEKLGRFVADLRFEQLPDAVIKEVKMRLADLLCVSLAASKTDMAQKVRRYVSAVSPKGSATVYGLDRGVAPAYAALANATMAFHLELDDVHRTSHMHPGICTIPAALSLGEAMGASGRDVITAVAAGYDASIRIGEAVSPSIFTGSVFLPTGVIGAVGAAASAASILKLKEREAVGAISSATYLGPLAPFYNYKKGPTIKEFIVGWCNFNGILCAQLAQNGFMGNGEAVEDEFGFCRALAKDYDLSLITKGLGEDYKIIYSGTKPYACCRQIHSTIDSVLELREKYALTPNQISSVHVRTFSVAARANAKTFPTVASAKYSIPYSVAVAMTDGRVWREQFSEERLKDPDLLALASKVSVSVDDELEALYDRKWPAIVEIVTVDGRKLTARYDLMKGEPEYPVTQSELREKFLSLTGDLTDTAHAASIWDTVMHLDDLDSVADLIHILDQLQY